MFHVQKDTIGAACVARRNGCGTRHDRASCCRRVALPAAAASAPPGCANANNNTYDKLLGCMTLGGVRTHQQAFQNIANANGGTRAAATPGYDASVDYVVGALEKAGWSVQIE